MKPGAFSSLYGAPPSFDPSGLPGVLDWFRGETASVSAWTNKIGGGPVSPAQAIPLNQPTMTTGINGKATVGFAIVKGYDGGNVVPTSGGSYWIFTVAKATTIAQYSTIYGRYWNANTFYIGGDEAGATG